MHLEGDKVNKDITGPVDKVTNVTGKKCPQCGAEGKWHGEHETTVRNYPLPEQTIVDVGWQCWNCGYEWGFEMPQS